MMMLHAQPTFDAPVAERAWKHATPRGAMSIGGATERRPAMRVAVAERRRGLRVAQARPVKVLDAVAGQTFAGQTLDVSATGLRVQLPAGVVLRVGEVLGIHVGLSRIGERLANRRQMIAVRVVWVNRQSGRRKGVVIAGVEFATGIGAQLDAA